MNTPSSGEALVVAPALAEAGRALHRARLVGPFGHVSARLSATQFLITRAVPPGTLTQRDVVLMPVAADELPDSAPKEAWIHAALYAARDDVGAVCRAQPATATAVTAASVPLRPLHGHGAFLGPEVPVYDDSRLIREPGSGRSLAATLQAASAVLLRGNGAVTVASTLAEAVALMWVLECSAEINLRAATCGTPRPLSAEEQAYWRRLAPELLERIWAHLRQEGAQR